MTHTSQPGEQMALNSRVGDYVLGSVLGEGAVAVVYQAHLAEDGAPTTPDQPSTVALKVLKSAAASQPHVLACFQFEARVLSRLDHPGILRVYDAGVDDEHMYTAMELVDGFSFDKFLLAKKRLTEAQSVNFARQLAEALDYLHGHGYVHRDIKPANLMLTREGRIMLFDFGTVIRISDGAAYEVGLYGTPAFLAPEQIEPGRRIDGRADLYALGMILYLMVTGRKPFYGGRNEVLDFHLHMPPPPPSNFARVSLDLEQIILRAIAKDPNDRFQTGAEFAAALESAALTPAPSTSSWRERLMGWLRRSA
jgi:serine/threonine protein kinase